MAETFVYASRIKDLAKKNGLRMSGDAAEALNAQIVLLFPRLMPERIQHFQQFTP